MHGVKRNLLPSSLPPLSHQPSIANSSSLNFRSLNSISASSASDNRERLVDAISLQSFNSQSILSYDKSLNDHPRYIIQETAPKIRDRTPPLVTEELNKEPLSNTSFISEASLTPVHSEESMFSSVKKKVTIEDDVKDVVDSLNYSDDQWESASPIRMDNNKFSNSNDEDKDKVFLAQALFPISMDTKSCHVQVFLAKEYDENFYLKVVTTGFSPHVYTRRTVDIDLVYEMIGSASANLKNLSGDVDMKDLTEMLLQLFMETDVDKTGSLSYAEFQTLMERIDLGISPQELNFVICEADEDENGTVDYNEFVPLAVDLIQSFKARNRARLISNQEDALTDDQIMKSMPVKEIELIAETCLNKLLEADPKGYGILKQQDFKKVLAGVGNMIGLKDREITMLCKILPRDQFNRIKYNNLNMPFQEAFSQARFMTIKAALLESRSSSLERKLMEACRKEEEKIMAEEKNSSFELTGTLPIRTMINILTNTSSMALTRMQIMVLIADAAVVDGNKILQHYSIQTIVNLISIIFIIIYFE